MHASASAILQLFRVIRFLNSLSSGTLYGTNLWQIRECNRVLLTLAWDIESFHHALVVFQIVHQHLMFLYQFSNPILRRSLQLFAKDPAAAIGFAPFFVIRFDFLPKLFCHANPDGWLRSLQALGALFDSWAFYLFHLSLEIRVPQAELIVGLALDSQIVFNQFLLFFVQIDLFRLVLKWKHFKCPDSLLQNVVWFGVHYLNVILF